MKMSDRFMLVLFSSILFVSIVLQSCNQIGFAQEPSLPTLRVLTYNIHHGEGTDGKFDYDRLAKIIADLKPDVVALQEVDKGTARANGVDQSSELAKRLGMNCAFGNALYYSGGEYGEAILSRFPIENAQAHHLPFRFALEPRTALAVTVLPDNGLPKLTFVGTHLCHQNEEIRTEQTRELNGLFANSELPVILAGDLNARPSSEPMNVLLTKNWIDTMAPNSKIDYVLVRKFDSWRVVESKIIDEPIASDHNPVLVVLCWDPESN